MNRYEPFNLKKCLIEFSAIRVHRGADCRRVPRAVPLARVLYDQVKKRAFDAFDAFMH